MRVVIIVFSGGPAWIRTRDLVIILEARGLKLRLVGLPGLEPGTSSLSVTRSNQLSYKPIWPTSLFSKEALRILPEQKQ
jgi:hypothetical protein